MKVRRVRRRLSEGIREHLGPANPSEGVSGRPKVLLKEPEVDGEPAIARDPPGLLGYEVVQGPCVDNYAS